MPYSKYARAAELKSNPPQAKISKEPIGRVVKVDDNEVTVIYRKDYFDKHFKRVADYSAGETN